eukprot:1986885-Pyramimonas_sp.AAC.1
MAEFVPWTAVRISYEDVYNCFSTIRVVRVCMDRCTRLSLSCVDEHLPPRRSRTSEASSLCGP